MLSAGLPPTPGDRANDAHSEWHSLGKPAILGRHTQRWLCATCLALIVYGTLGPLGLGHGPWLAPARTWHWIPLEQRTDANDVFTNVLVYVPVGVAFRLLVRRRGRAGWPDFVVGLALSALLSYATEILQQFMPGRVSNLIDVYVNIAAAFVGGLIAVPLQALLRRLHALAFVQIHVRRRIWAVAAILALVATIVVMTMPWDLKRPCFNYSFRQDVRTADPWALARLAVFGTLGFLLAARAIASRQSRRVAVAGSVLRGCALTLTMEFLQTVLAGHVGSLIQVFVATLGAGTGAWLATRLVAAPSPDHRGRQQPLARAATPPILPARLQRLGTVLLLGILTVLVLRGVLPGALRGHLRTEPAFEWMPFKAHFAAPFAVALADMFKQGTAYAVVASLCLLLTRGRRPWAALLVLLSTLGGIAACQAFFEGQRPDTTPLLLACGAWAIVARLWSSVYPAARVQDLRVTA